MMTYFNAYTATRRNGTLSVYFNLTRDTIVKMTFAPSYTSQAITVSVSETTSMKRNATNLSFIERSIVSKALDMVSGLGDDILPLSFEISVRYSNVSSGRIFHQR